MHFLRSKVSHQMRILLVFTSALTVGIIFAIIKMKSRASSQELSSRLAPWRSGVEPHSSLYKNWLDGQKVKRAVDDSELKDADGFQVVPEWSYLQHTVRVLCFIMLKKETPMFQTWPYMPAMSSAAKAIADTWGRRCAKTIFFSNIHSPDVDYILLDVRNQNSWLATKKALQHLIEKYLDDYNWFVKAEEDTYIIPENLNYFLSVYNASQPHYFGHAYSAWTTLYNSGGPGYVLSKGAMRKLASQFVKGKCNLNSGSEDVTLGRCLDEMGVAVEDTRDYMGRARFIMYQPEIMLVPGSLPWTETFWRDSKYISKEGPDCCSDVAVSFHYVPPNMMYVFDYLVYRLKPFGIGPKAAPSTGHSQEKFFPANPKVLPANDAQAKGHNQMENEKLEKYSYIKNNEILGDADPQGSLTNQNGIHGEGKSPQTDKSKKLAADGPKKLENKYSIPNKKNKPNNLDDTITKDSINSAHRHKQSMQNDQEELPKLKGPNEKQINKRRHSPQKVDKDMLDTDDIR